MTLSTDDFNQAIIDYVRKHGNANCPDDAVVDCDTGCCHMGDITVEWEVEMA